MSNAPLSWRNAQSAKTLHTSQINSKSSTRTLAANLFASFCDNFIVVGYCDITSASSMRLKVEHVVQSDAVTLWKGSVEVRKHRGRKHICQGESHFSGIPLLTLIELQQLTYC
jgi:hypothetical protein